MRIDEARTRAADWVSFQAMGTEVTGAFFSGSSLDARPLDELSPDSDIDLVLVVTGEVPEKRGKVNVDGLALDVSYLARDAVADPARVARTFYLAPSFRTNAIVLDRDGQLGRVADHVRRVFADPPVLRDRCADVLERMDARLAAVAQARSWAERLLLWVFAASLPTQVLLVAGLRNPTVRLRYRATRELLADRGLAERYPELLAHLGAEALTPSVVREQLARLPAVFDAAAALTSDPGVQTQPVPASDLGPAGRAVALAGSERLIEAGDHREAVFWLIVTFLRAQLVLDAAAEPGVAARYRATVAEAVAALTGLRTPDDLALRTELVVQFRSRLLSTADVLVSGPR